MTHVFINNQPPSLSFCNGDDLDWKDEEKSLHQQNTKLNHFYALSLFHEAFMDYLEPRRTTVFLQQLLCRRRSLHLVLEKQTSV